jgi:hypothetical protein
VLGDASEAAADQLHHFYTLFQNVDLLDKVSQPGTRIKAVIYRLDHIWNMSNSDLSFDLLIVVHNAKFDP